MKLFLIITAFLIAQGIQAQELVIDKEKLRERAMQFQLRGKDTLKQEQLNVVVARPSNEVRILPQDGMPCIVPDTRAIAAMPNALRRPSRKDPVPGQMPNAWPGRKRQPDNNDAK